MYIIIYTVQCWVMQIINYCNEIAFLINPVVISLLIISIETRVTQIAI